MSQRPPRTLATSRSDELAAPAAAADEPATDDADGSERPPGDAEHPEASGDTALLGAYALGALTSEERADVEERLAASPALQDELRRLMPVAVLLREASDLPPTPVTAEPSRATLPETMAATPADVAPGAPAAPTVRTTPRSRTELGSVPDAGDGPDRDRAGADPVPNPKGDQSPSDAMLDHPDDAATTPTRVEAAPGSLSSRPTRRPSRPAAEPRPTRPRRATVAARWPLSWTAAGLATLVAIGAVLWSLAMVDRLDTRRAQVAALEAEVRALRARGGGAVVALAPGDGGPAGADGVVIVAPSEGFLIVRASGIPVSAEGRVYQVWFQNAADGAEDRWIVGPVFRVGEAGTALVELPAAVPAFTRLAVSDEPSPGGDAPSGSFLLEGTVADGTAGTPSP